MTLTIRFIRINLKCFFVLFSRLDVFRQEKTATNDFVRELLIRTLEDITASPARQVGTLAILLLMIYKVD
jgi:hypothetical protein